MNKHQVLLTDEQVNQAKQLLLSQINETRDLVVNGDISGTDGARRVSRLTELLGAIVDPTLPKPFDDVPAIKPEHDYKKLYEHEHAGAVALRQELDAARRRNKVLTDERQGGIIINADEWCQFLIAGGYGPSHAQPSVPELMVNLLRMREELRKALDALNHRTFGVEEWRQLLTAVGYKEPHGDDLSTGSVLRRLDLIRLDIEEQAKTIVKLSRQNEDLQLERDAAVQTAKQAQAQDGIFAEIIVERDRQDSRWGGPDHDDTHDLDDWSRFIDERLPTERDRIIDGRPKLIKVAALAVAAVESLDRKSTMGRKHGA